jgi:hypothetical protein
MELRITNYKAHITYYHISRITYCILHIAHYSTTVHPVYHTVVVHPYSTE